MKIIIIEDEARTADELKKMLISLDSEIEIMAILPTVASAIAWLKENPLPDIVFSDIELGDGLSFEIFRQIEVNTPVIFCTAFDEYAIRAFDSNSIGYLLKPVDERMLSKSLEKYMRLKNQHTSDIQNALNLDKAILQLESTYKQTLLVSFREKIIPVKILEIGLIYASGGTVMIFVADKTYPIAYTLEQLEGIIDPNQFFRANRQFLVNRDFIKNIEHYFNRKLIIITNLDPPEKIIVSRVKAQIFLKWMER